MLREDKRCLSFMFPAIKTGNAHVSLPEATPFPQNNNWTTRTPHLTWAQSPPPVLSIVCIFFSYSSLNSLTICRVCVSPQGLSPSCTWQGSLHGSHLAHLSGSSGRRQSVVVFLGAAASILNVEFPSEKRGLLLLFYVELSWCALRLCHYFDWGDFVLAARPSPIAG